MQSCLVCLFQFFFANNHDFIVCVAELLPALLFDIACNGTIVLRKDAEEIAQQVGFLVDRLSALPRIQLLNERCDVQIRKTIFSFLFNFCTAWLE